MGFSPKCSADIAYFGGVHNSKPYLWYIFMHRDTYAELMLHSSDVTAVGIWAYLIDIALNLELQSAVAAKHLSNVL